MAPLPMPEPLGIPAPAWIIQIIYELSHVLHILFMSIVLGCSIILTAHLITAQENEFFSSLNRRLVKILFPATIFALATAFLPLLTYHTNYAHLVLTSDIMLGGFKLGLPLAAAALLISVSARKLWDVWLDKHPRRALALALTIMAVAIFTAALTANSAHLVQRPDLWFNMADSNLPVVPDISFAPSFAIILLRSVGICGVAIALIGYAENLNERATKYGFRLLLICTALGALAGLWFFISLPSIAKEEVFAGPPGTSVTLIATYILSTFLVGTAILGIMRPRNRLWGRIAAGIVVLITFGVISTGSMVREALLQPHFNPLDLPLREQTTFMIIFFICLAAALAAAGTISYWLLRGTSIQHLGSTSKS